MFNLRDPDTLSRYAWTDSDKQAVTNPGFLCVMTASSLLRVEGSCLSCSAQPAVRLTRGSRCSRSKAECWWLTFGIENIEI